FLTFSSTSSQLCVERCDQLVRRGGLDLLSDRRTVLRAVLVASPSEDRSIAQLRDQSIEASPHLCPFVVVHPRGEDCALEHPELLVYERAVEALLSGQALQQKIGQLDSIWIIEDKRARQSQPGDGHQAIAQLDRHKRVEAELLEATRDIQQVG